MNPDLALVAHYVLPGDRAGWLAVAMLDTALADLVRTTREPMIGRIRLAWWREAVARLASGPPPAEPVLLALAAAGVPPDPLRAMIDGWEALAGDTADPAGIAEFVQGRGAALAATLAGDDGVAAVVARWAGADLARHASDPALAAKALELAGTAPVGAWPRRWRAAGALAVMARRDARRGPGALEPADAPGRVLRALTLRLTGR